ncbi:hypothetical protein HDU82_001691, partial [Entophlyctis luteolus]
MRHAMHVLCECILLADDDGRMIACAVWLHQNFMTNTAPAILQVQEDADSDALQPQPRPAAFFPAAAAGYLRVADDDADKDPVPSSNLTDDAASAPAIVPGAVAAQRSQPQQPTRFSKAKAALLAHMGRGTDGVFANLGAVGPVAVSAETSAACPSSAAAPLSGDDASMDPPSYRNVFADAVAIPETDDQ